MWCRNSCTPYGSNWLKINLVILLTLEGWAERTTGSSGAKGVIDGTDMEGYMKQRNKGMKNEGGGEGEKRGGKGRKVMQEGVSPRG